MNIEQKKLYLIGEILKIEDYAILIEVEKSINKNKFEKIENNRFEKFSGIWTSEEAIEMKKNIK